MCYWKRYRHIKTLCQLVVKRFVLIQVWRSKKVVFCKRSMGGGQDMRNAKEDQFFCPSQFEGYADLDNPVFYKSNTELCLGHTSTIASVYKRFRSWFLDSPFCILSRGYFITSAPQEMLLGDGKKTADALVQKASLGPCGHMLQDGDVWKSTLNTTRPTRPM